MGIEDFLSSGNPRLDQQLKFTAEIDKMTEVYRRTMLISGVRHENDAEHSWHIAVMALLFKEYCFTGCSGTNVIRLLPPLCLTIEQADQFVEKFTKVLNDF